MPRTLTIGRRFGALYVLLVGLLTTVCVVVLVHVQSMRDDADRLIEETREQVLIQQLVRETAELRALLVRRDSTSGQELEERLVEARELVRSIENNFDSLHAQTDDPSRDEHQAAEDDLARRAKTELSEVSLQLVDQQTWSQRSESLDELTLLQEFADTLDRETGREVRLADRDLERRARAAGTILVLTYLSATAILCLCLLLVLRTVVAPLRLLRDGADRLGKGDLMHRMHLNRADEIGDLARAFDQMAGRLLLSHAELEERVAARTREFLRAARLADIGVLAAGVAHEINNPLASIASCAEGLQRRLQRGSLTREEELEYLGTITAEAYRARDITSRLLALARKDRGEVAELDLGLLLRQVEGAVRPLLQREGQTLYVEAPPLAASLRANAGELVQILVNLVLNAKDASPAGSSIRLECKANNQWVVFRIIDMGSGIPSEQLDKIFDPFFTTKPAGKGTGLGLSVVHAMVESRGGRIEVASQLGVGSEFTVHLPRSWDGNGVDFDAG